MDNDSEDVFVNRLQLLLAKKQGDEFEDKFLVCIGLVFYGLEEERHRSVFEMFDILLAQPFSLIHT